MSGNKIESKAEQILRRYFDGKYPDDVRGYVQGWIASKDSEEEKNARLRKIFDRMVEYKHNPGDKAFEMLAEWHRRLGVSRTLVVKRHTPFYHTLRFKVAAAAFPLFLVVGVSLFVFTRPKVGVPMAAIAYVNVPDTLGALARVDMSDGTMVLVRPGGSVSYAKKLNGGDKRLMILTEGEVYMNVAKDTTHRFVVETPYLKVNVLGTAFNVEALSDSEYTVVTLYQGRITVNGISGKESLTEIEMNPGQRLIYDNDTDECRIEKTNALLPEWVARKLTFEDATYTDIIRTIEWFYGVAVDVDGVFNQKGDLYFRFTGKEDIETAMQVFQSISREFTYEISGGTVKISVTN